MEKLTTRSPDNLLLEPEVKVTPPKKSSFKKAALGFLLAMVSSMLNVTSSLLLKKTSFFNEFDNSTIRYIIQLSLLFIIAKATDNSTLGKRSDLKLLVARGAISGVGLVSLYTSIKLIDPSDAISLFSCNVIFVAILSRIFLKEKFTVMHLMALVFVVCGVFLITQPSFLVSNDAQMTMLNATSSNVTEELLISQNVTAQLLGLNSIDNILQWVGYFFGVFSGFVYASAAILIKEMSKKKVHFTTINLYAAYFGLPMCIVLSAVAFELDYKPKDLTVVYENGFAMEMIITFLSALFGVLSQVFWIMSLKFEDATKIAMYRTTDLLLAFVFQRLFLHIESNVFSILGAIFIAIGMLTVIGFKLIDKNEKSKLKRQRRLNEREMEAIGESGDKIKLDVNEEEFTRDYRCLKRFIFYKF